MALNPEKDWRKPGDKNHLSNEDYRTCLTKFEEFLESTGVCFFVRRGWLFDEDRYSVIYSVYAPPDNRVYDDKEVSRIDFMVRPVNSKRKIDYAPGGYMIVSPSEFAAVMSDAQMQRTMYCNYFHEENEMLFKPAAWVSKYIKAVAQDPQRVVETKGHTRSEIFMRLDVKPLKEERKTIPARGAGIMQASVPRLQPGQMMHFRDFTIKYSGNCVVTQEDMKAFLLSHNTYPDMWKLKFKVLKNILAKEI